MKPILILQNDLKTPYSPIELKEILAFIKDGIDYQWKIFWLEATGNPGDMSILKLEEIIKKSKDGYLIDWVSLLKLSDKLYQVIEIILIGDKDLAKLNIYSSVSDIQAFCSFSLELVDSSYWEIRSDNMSFLKKIKDNFKIFEKPF